MSPTQLSALLLAALVALASSALPSAASPLDAIDDADEEALQALALYPEDVRERALVVASEPARVVELQKLQDESRDDFRDLLAPYSQDDQEQLFELSRYPGLVEEIARGGEKSRGELERIAAGHPEDVRAAAVRQGSERHRVVSRMHALLADSERSFDELIEDLPPPKREAFRGMLATPELLSLLSEHMDMTVLLGDAYERDPRGLRDALAELNVELARRNAEDADDWQRSVESDPDLRRDYDAAARDYQDATGFSAYRAPSGPSVSIHINPFPFWFGYPWWYPVSYHYYDPWYWWYPRHAWVHCGYRYGPRVVVYGGPVWRPWYPSFHFTSWYFSAGHHHHRYPHLSSRFIAYYERPVVVGHRHHHYDGRKRVVRKFVYDTDRAMPAGYLHGKDGKQRVERLREYGKIAPVVEKVEQKAWHQEAAGKRGTRPGKDFEIRERGADPAVRAETRKRVALDPKEFPELSKVGKQDWERDRDRSRGQDAKGREQGGRGASPSFESRGGAAREKDRAERGTPRFESPSGEQGRGAEREPGRSSKRQRDGAGDTGAGAAPTFDAPDRGRGRDAPKTERAAEPKRSRSYDAPTADAPKTQAPRNQEQRYQRPKQQERMSEPRTHETPRSQERKRETRAYDTPGYRERQYEARTHEAPRSRERKYDTPTYQAPRNQQPQFQPPAAAAPAQREPRAARSGGGGERSVVREQSVVRERSGGGGGGGNKSRNDAAPEQTDPSGGHAGRGRRDR
jgi:hypothetical protein